MVRITRSVEIGASPEEVWRALEGASKGSGWRRPGGSKYSGSWESSEFESWSERGSSSPGPSARGSPFEIVVHDPPHRFAWRYGQRRGSLAVSGHFQLWEAGIDRTRLEIGLEYRASGMVWRLLEPLIRFFAGPLLHRIGLRIKQSIQSDGL